MASQAGKRTIKLTERGSQFSKLLLARVRKAPLTPRRDGNVHRSRTSIERELDEILANANPDDNPDDDEYVDDNDANDHASDDHAEDVDGAEPESEDSDVPNNLSIFDAPRW
ncbi:hypothetical protein B5807_06302 [Epicoccum nigrum]|uniref:Uncharacterized protein n=1 Tax=Epicoccum nigrum TaxID=105696 RepID=A0A1Y2M1J3_EPING|nr:hypothetical protein B5807_06302 [Epicoccum nigrum]